MIKRIYGQDFLAKKLSMLLFLSSLIFTACQKEIKQKNSPEVQPTSAARFENNGKGSGTVSPEMVLRWNEAATYVVQQTQAIISDPPIPPFIESRYYAMVNIAMHDALNSIVPKYKTYALSNVREKEADADAAVAKAAHDVIVFFFGKLNPPAGVTPQPVQDYIDNLLTQ
jgi:hypothetical protein